MDDSIGGYFRAKRGSHENLPRHQLVLFFYDRYHLYSESENVSVHKLAIICGKRIQLIACLSANLHVPHV